MSMVLNKVLVIVIFFLVSNINVFSQKLDEDGYKVSIESFTKQESGFCGQKNNVYSGIFKVKSKQNQKGKYIFILSQVNPKLSMLMIKTIDNESLNPVIVFDNENKSFYYTENKEKVKEIIIGEDLSMENYIIKGILFWLKINYEIKTKSTN